MIAAGVINEVLQWLALAAVLLLLLALYRQLGLMVVRPQQYLEASFGPHVGERLPARTLDLLPALGDPVQQVLVLTQPECTACEHLLAELAKNALYRTPTTVARTSQGMPIPSKFNAVDTLALPSLLQKPPAYPFLFLLSADGTVLSKHVGQDPTPLLREVGALSEPAELKEHQPIDLTPSSDVLTPASSL